MKSPYNGTVPTAIKAVSFEAALSIAHKAQVCSFIPTKRPITRGWPPVALLQKTPRAIAPDFNRVFKGFINAPAQRAGTVKR